MENQDLDLEAVMRRVRKLLAIAEDSRADSNEAAAAARMAESVMRKYQIEHAEVLMASLNAGKDDIFAEAFVSGALKEDGRAESVKAWASWLAVGVANLNDCQARFAWTPELGKCLRFTGYAADVQISQYMYEFIVRAMISAANQYRKDTVCNRAEANSFRQGYIVACYNQLKRALADKKQEMAQQSTSRALVLVKSQAVAKHFGEVTYSKGKTRSRQGDAYQDGKEQGSKLDVTRKGVGMTGKTLKIA